MSNDNQVKKLTNKSFTEQAGMKLVEQYEYHESKGPDQKSVEYTFKDVELFDVRDIAEKFGLVYIYQWNDGEKSWAVDELSRIKNDECMSYDEEDKTLSLFGWSTRVN